MVDDTKNEVGTLSYTNYPSLTSLIYNFYAKTEIDSTLNDYTTSAQLHTDFIAKLTNLIFDTYTTTTQLYDDF